MRLLIKNAKGLAIFKLIAVLLSLVLWVGCADFITSGKCCGGILYITRDNYTQRLRILDINSNVENIIDLDDLYAEHLWSASWSPDKERRAVLPAAGRATSYKCPLTGPSPMGRFPPRPGPPRRA